MLDHLRRFYFAWTLIRAVSRFIDRCPRPVTRGRSGWINLRYGNFYIRLTKRVIDDEIFETLEIASVEIKQKYQRRGFFTVALTMFENQAFARGIKVVRVENVHNEHLYDFLIRRCYRPMKYDLLSLYREIHG